MHRLSMRKTFLLLLGAISACLTLYGAPKNVLLISVDDPRPQLAIFGARHHAALDDCSPNLEAFSWDKARLGSAPREKSDASKAFVDLNNENAPVAATLDLTAASHSASGYPISAPTPSFPQLGVLEVIRTDTGTSLFELEDAMSIDPYQLATRKLSIRASVPDLAGGSVIFELNGEVIRTLNTGPFSLGGHDGASYGSWFPGAGEHTLRVIPYSMPNGGGVAGDPIVRQFTVDDTLEHRTTSIQLSVPAGATIEVKMKQHEFPFGAMLNAELFHDRNNLFSEQDEAQYKQTFLENFNYAVHGNAMKWYAVEPDWWINSPNYNGSKRWNDAELVWNWANGNGIPMRGHSVFWGMDTATNSGEMWDPDWVEALNDVDLENTAEERARDFASRWAGRIDQMDTNNEMWHGNYYSDRLGSSITKKMHDWILAENPNAELYVNDYNILNSTSNATSYRNFIQGLINGGAVVHGIGVQGHFSSPPSKALVDNTLGILDDLGLPIFITEYDSSGSNETAKANALENVFRAGFENPLVDGIIQWGFWKGRHWVPGRALFDTDWTPLPAAVRYRELVYDEWWTNLGGTATDDGAFDFPCFYGDYEIMVNGITTSITISEDSTIRSFAWDGTNFVGNEAPSVDAGEDFTLSWPNHSTWLRASASDDGQPTGSSLSTSWEQISGPLPATIHSPEITETTVTFYQSGIYEFRCSTTDGILTGADTVMATVRLGKESILENGGFEDGLTHWIRRGGASVVTLTSVGNPVTEGSLSVELSSRTQPWAGIHQDVTSKLSLGRTYDLVFYAQHNGSGNENLNVQLIPVISGTQDFSNAWSKFTSASPNEWHRISGTFTVTTEQDAADELRLTFYGPSPGIDFYLDGVTLVERPLDSDGNGLSDDWEHYFFETTGNPADRDSDSDGMTDLEEMIAGTDPIDRFSNLSATLLESGGGMQFRWGSAPGRKYTLWKSATLLPNSWMEVSTGLNGDGSILSYPLPAPVAPEEFYQITVED